MRPARHARAGRGGRHTHLVGNLRLALRGTYDEGCCDRYVYDFGNVRLEPDFFEALELGLQEDPRFLINVSWATGRRPEYAAVPARLGGNLGYFWFFSPDNPEIFVKIVSACDTPFERVWFFASGLTNLGVRIEVTDRMERPHEDLLQSSRTAVRCDPGHRRVSVHGVLRVRRFRERSGGRAKLSTAPYTVAR